jgi:hypothetical protein
VLCGSWHLAPVLVLGLPQTYIGRIHCRQGRRCVLQLLRGCVRKVRDLCMSVNKSEQKSVVYLHRFHGRGSAMTYCRTSAYLLVTTVQAL